LTIRHDACGWCRETAAGLSLEPSRLQRSGAYRTTLVDSNSSGSPSPYFRFLATDSSGFFPHGLT
jgi:hypothetical protein